jgi:hypothetical protein
LPLTLKPQLAIEDRADPVIECAGRRLTVGFEDYWRPTAANYWGLVKRAHGLGRKILGERWARITPTTRSRFSPPRSKLHSTSTNAACIALGQTERGNAATWLPPSMAYDNDLADNASAAA